MSRFRLFLSCGCNRLTRSLFDTSELQHPERWINSNAWCDHCGARAVVVHFEKQAVS
jgi:hypothetical protein